MERNTRQRQAIKRALIDAKHPLAVQEVLDAAKVHCPSLGIATVYRTLKEFVDDGSIALVELPSEAPRYETSDKDHHHHFSCRSCGQIYEIEGCLSELERLTPSGFQLEHHDVLLAGTCANCSKTKI